MPTVIYQDDEILVINKPAAMPVHPLREGDVGTALQWVVDRYPEVGVASDDPREGGLCHRLDNDTSGLLLFARSRETYSVMREAFQKGRIKRRYLALLNGKLLSPLLCELPIAHHPKNKRKMVAVVNPALKSYFRGEPQEATTRIEPLEYGQGVTFAEVALFGGRRHQIRVHAAKAGFPLVGDVLYGGPQAKYLAGQALHAWQLILPDGREIKAPLPQGFIQEAAHHGLDSLANRVDFR